MDRKIITEVADEVKGLLAFAEGGHDWWHIYRVWQNAREIANGEDDVDHFVIELAALLHDIADSKFHEGNEEIGPQKARDILLVKNIANSTIDHVVNIIRHMSFKNSLERTTWTSQELAVVRDADRLDAIGAIGIARAFNYGGYKNRLLYHPDIPPVLHMSKEAYKKNKGPTINHFYEKLLQLKDMMHTGTGKALAEKRHSFMLVFLEAFYDEVGQVPLWHQDYISSE